MTQTEIDKNIAEQMEDCDKQTAMQAKIVEGLEKAIDAIRMKNLTQFGEAMQSVAKDAGEFMQYLQEKKPEADKGGKA